MSVSRLIAIDASMRPAHVSLVINGAAVVERSAGDERSAENLIQMIAEAVREASLEFRDFDAVCVAGGPGSFTGVRNGLATAQGIAMGLGIPVFRVNLLLARCLERGIGLGSAVLVPVLGANRQEFYAACYLFACDSGWHAGGPAATVRRLARPSVVSRVGLDDYIEDILEEKAAVIGEAGKPEVVSVDYPDPWGNNPATAIAFATLWYSVRQGEGSLQAGACSSEEGEHDFADIAVAPEGLGLSPVYVRKPCALTLAERCAPAVQ